ncbi:hypothetical protein NCAS_0H03270 [Naumovozyma castellii]|uniref:Ribosome biogenesis protein ERB1 n=1 Tax=Naumovozyma castellii TaxID=27288 RepID=G0VJF8_NAUCA|nr:hypothetical protein NCAS_0H03270 [Naumovozyma castellii CBS 4309]CCC71637.1 hypothetical protein NCAS_0H03270 [Naumovozyma castellii CBS 4309]
MGKVTKSTTEVADTKTGSKKRSVDDVEANVKGNDETFSVDGLLDGESDSDDEAFESAQEEEGKSLQEAEENDSDAELNKLLAEEEGDSGEEYNTSDFDDDNEDTKSLVDKLSGVKLKTIADPNVYTKFSDGQPRIIKPEINPVYDSDDSDVETKNTIGNIPLSAYDEMPHIGYDINGKRIMRPAKGSALDQLLDTIELPEGWTGLLDQSSGAALNLTEEELELISKIERNEQTDDTNPYEPYVDWFTRHEEVMPLTAIPEPKRRFVPSKNEAKRIMKIVKAIREGRIIPPKKLKELRQKEENEEHYKFDLWGDSTETNDHVMHLRAPKLPPPTNEESYNPPEEYLLNDEEKKEWENTEVAEREKNFIPQKYGALRKVPGYGENIRERFERSLDLYLAPRVRKNVLNIDPESLIPELPSPKDLRPFPIRCSTIFAGHKGKIRTLSIDPSGLWLATGSDDGTVRVWEILTGREVYKVSLIDDTEENSDDHIECIEWNPDKETGILAVAVGENIHLIVPPIFGFDIENAGKTKIEHGFGFDTFGTVKKSNMEVNGSDDENDAEANNVAAVKKQIAQWNKPSQKQLEKDICITITCKKTVKRLSWHRKGDYFVTIQPDSGNTSVLIHQLSKHLTQSPFKKSKGIIMDAKFHPFKPQLFVCSQRYIRIYDLSQQTLVKKLLPGARWLSKIDIHPRGDNLIASSFDKRVLWHDLDLASTPYKTLRYHDKAVRSVNFHKRLPLFSSVADDGNIHIFHATVYDDMMKNPMIVPLKKLTGHKIKNSLGVLDAIWHPREAWLFSAGADNTARLWTT